jgi:V/A-type H+/Na+-transporting ATPase subunit K
MVSDMALVAAGIAVAGCGMAAGYAEAHAIPAAIGAMAEKEDFFGKGLLMCVVPESIAIFGLVVALIIIFVV